MVQKTKLLVQVGGLAATFAVTKLMGLPTSLCIVITATVGVAIFELFHTKTVWATIIGLFALSVYYASQSSMRHLLHTFAHEGEGMISLYFLLIGGALLAKYVLPRTHIAPVLSRALPSDRYLPIAIYILGFAISWINPVLGVGFMLTLIKYEYKSYDPLLIVGSVFVANTAAASSPFSDVGATLVANHIPFPSTWEFTLPFTIACGLIATIWSKRQTSPASDSFKQRLNLKETSIFIALVAGIILSQKLTGYLWAGMGVIILYVVTFYPKATDGRGKRNDKELLKVERRHLYTTLKELAIGFAFLPILVLLWGCVQAEVPALFGEFTTFKEYLLAPASGCFDNVALTVGIIKENVHWAAAITGLCIGGSLLSFSSAAAAAMNERAKVALPSWFLAAIPFFVAYSTMWWAWRTIIALI